jgi:hypothetical protein
MVQKISMILFRNIDKASLVKLFHTSNAMINNSGVVLKLFHAIDNDIFEHGFRCLNQFN